MKLFHSECLTFSIRRSLLIGQYFFSTFHEKQNYRVFYVTEMNGGMNDVFFFCKFVVVWKIYDAYHLKEILNFYKTQMFIQIFSKSLK